MKIDRREFLKAAAMMGMFMPITEAYGSISQRHVHRGSDACTPDVKYLHVSLKEVPRPKNIRFSVQHQGKTVKLAAHYWYNARLLERGEKCPAILEINPYRRRDGMLLVDSMMYPWFARNGYLCFRVDLQGTGDSEGIITDEYTEEELSYCVQLVTQIAELPFCDGNVGMMGKSWSAINSLMVAARDDCPPALKAIIVCCGSDDRYNDDVHYMGGAMMMDNVSWPSAMWGWLPLPPDPVIVGDGWKEMWRERIRNMTFWFEQWAGHQTRDRYWSETSVRDHYDKVKVPVFVLSGWQDGYKNSVDRIVTGLGGLGLPVAGLLGPWGHKYPFDGYPGPRIDWLDHIVTHWWDRWLKGRRPPPHEAWPELTVLLGESREPDRDRVPAYMDSGKWVAEDRDWMSRIENKTFFLSHDSELSPRPDRRRRELTSTPDITLGTSVLETSSWGECSNDDLPGNQQRTDVRSLHFDSERLTGDLECFGYPTVALNLECNLPLASLAIRLCEVSPKTERSHLVTYRFFNLCYRDGDMANPSPVPPGLFSVQIPLNVMGHIFKRGWRIRLSISPFFFPTLWQSPEIATVTIHTGPIGDLPPSGLDLPERRPLPADRQIQALLSGSETRYVNPKHYVRTLKTEREASFERTAARITVNGRRGMLVKKTFDSGSYLYGGALDHLLVDEVARESYQLLDEDPLSATGTTEYRSMFKRGDWKVTAVTRTRVWTEESPRGQVAFRYEAHAQGFIGDELFEEKHLEGAIPRIWV